MPKNPYNKFMNELLADPVRLKAFMRKVIGAPRRTLEGEERTNMLLILGLKEPVSSSNNQISWTDVYEHNGREYHVTSSSGIADIIDEMLDD